MLNLVRSLLSETSLAKNKHGSDVCGRQLLFHKSPILFNIIVYVLLLFLNTSHYERIFYYEYQ
nr:MAG TPA: hypothetical protein [Caudoviricetes sp.]